MTREEAAARVANFYDKPIPFIGALEALGLLKLDTPVSVHQVGVEFIASMSKNDSWQRPEVVAEDLAKAGFVLVRSWRKGDWYSARQVGVGRADRRPLGFLPARRPRRLGRAAGAPTRAEEIRAHRR